MGKLQYKLVRLFIFTSILPIIVLAIITIFLIQRIALQDTYQKIINNLNVAKSIYQDIKENLKEMLKEQNIRFAVLLTDRRINILQEEIKAFAQKENLDFFVIVDNKSKIVVSINDVQKEDKDLSINYMIEKALLEGSTSASLEILNKEELKLLGIYQKAMLGNIKDIQGLVIQVTMPIINPQEGIIGAISAGYLLNNNNTVVDKIKEKTGFVSSIFLGDVRICSNVPSRKNEFAVGTKLKPEFANKVLKEGKIQIGQIQVLGRYFIAGYSPIYDYNKNIIGILGIGIPKDIVYALRNKLIYIFIITVLISIVLSLVFGILKGKEIVQSIQKLRQVTEAVTKGDLEQRIKIHSNDEIEELANFFNKMVFQLKQARDQMATLIITDSLTGLFNHRYFHEQLQIEILRSLRYKHSLSLIMFDIDSFKSCNDRYGHLEGDRILKEIASIIKNNLRRVDIVCRYGGEEFMVIMPNTNLKDTKNVAEKIRKKIEEMSLIHSETGQIIKVTVSAGVSTYHEGQTKEILISHVDKALYKAKAEGKNKVCIFD